SYDLLRTSSLIEATAATHCHPLSLHDALPICTSTSGRAPPQVPSNGALSIRSGGIRVLMSSSDKECGSTAPVRTASPTSTSANWSARLTAAQYLAHAISSGAMSPCACRSPYPGISSASSSVRVSARMVRSPSSRANANRCSPAPSWVSPSCRIVRVVIWSLQGGGCVGFPAVTPAGSWRSRRRPSVQVRLHSRSQGPRMLHLVQVHVDQPGTGAEIHLVAGTDTPHLTAAGANPRRVLRGPDVGDDDTAPVLRAGHATGVGELLRQQVHQ